MATSRVPRGVRNKNPLNIRHSKAKWLGLAATQTDKEFCQFREMRYGWRAAFMLLCGNYYMKRGLHTLDAIIERWAPASDGNYPKAYALRVAAAVGVSPDAELPHPAQNAAIWRRIGWAMAQVENGNYKLYYWDMVAGYALWFNTLKK